MLSQKKTIAGAATLGPQGHTVFHTISQLKHGRYHQFHHHPLEKWWGNSPNEHPFLIENEMVLNNSTIQAINIIRIVVITTQLGRKLLSEPIVIETEMVNGHGKYEFSRKVWAIFVWQPQNKTVFFFNSSRNTKWRMLSYSLLWHWNFTHLTWLYF